MTRCKRCGEARRTLGDYLGEGMCNACFRGDRCARELIDEWWEVRPSDDVSADCAHIRLKTVAVQLAVSLPNTRLVHVRRYKVVL